MKHVKQHFITGLVILLPLAVTLFVILVGFHPYRSQGLHSTVSKNIETCVFNKKVLWETFNEVPEDLRRFFDLVLVPEKIPSAPEMLSIFPSILSQSTLGGTSL